MTASDAALLAAVLLAVAAAAAFALNRCGRCPAWVVTALEVGAVYAAVLAGLLVACGVPLTVDLFPSARTLIAVGFYGGLLALLLLGGVVATAVYLNDARDADDARRLTEKGDGLP